MQLVTSVVLGALAGLLGSALYAGSVVIYRSQAEEMSALVVSATKMFVALPFMAVLVLLGPGPTLLTFPVETIIFLALSIILGAVVGDTLYLIAQERIGVSYAFPIAMSFPIITYFLAMLFLGEPFLLSRLAGVVISVAGVVTISRERQTSQRNQMKEFDALGVGLALITALLYAAGAVILQVGVTDADPISTNFVRVLFGSVAFVPMLGAAFGRGMKRPTGRALKAVVVAGFFGMAIGSLLYVTSVKLAGATITSVVGSTAPLFAVPISVFHLKEEVTKKTLLGVITTVLGVILVVMGF
ncbi:DMT family transporter [Candidatus Thorarchaeota archaeon]|nr:MAG: DMT family transporter [Candidatus Thorarchaeota archaeon]